MAGKKEEVKATEKVVAEKIAAPAAEEVKAEPKKRGRKPGSTTKTTAKAPAEKAAAKTEIILQYGSQEADVCKLEEKVKAAFVAEGHRAGTIKSLNIYVKPEDYAAYYVINEKFSGRVDLF